MMQLRPATRVTVVGAALPPIARAGAALARFGIRRVSRIRLHFSWRTRTRQKRGEKGLAERGLFTGARLLDSADVAHRLATVDIRCVMRDDQRMRTTLNIDEDILQAAKEIAANRATTTGRVLSDLARRALEPKRASRVRNGVPLMPRRTKGSARPTMDLVNRLRDDL